MRLALAAACACLASPAPPADDVTIPYGELAAGFLEQHGLAGSDPAAVDVEALLDAGFARVHLGLFDLRAPADALEGKEAAERVQAAALALIEAQAAWLEWLAYGDAGEPALAEDLEATREWVESWRTRDLADVSGAESRDLLVALGAGEEQRAAVERFADAMARGVPLGLERSAGRWSRILVMPTRTDFVTFCSFAGWRYPDLRSLFWTPDLADWVGCRVQQAQVVALEYADPRRRNGDWTQGLAMDHKTKTGLEQNVAHFGGQALLDNLYGDRLPPWFATGLTMNLVIAVFGELDTRVEGDLRARYSADFSVFVPGGNPAGGVLAAYSQESRWRETVGKDHFVKILKESQKLGHKEERDARTKLLHFLLRAKTEGTDKAVVSAPFLGSATSDKPSPPADFTADYMEFFRAYKCAFCFWLQSAAGGKKKESAASFARLLRGAAEGDDFEAALTAVYGEGLTSAQPDDGVLEGRFLEWLSKR